MSRLANKSKAGFFPTPAGIAELVATHIAPPGTTGAGGGSYRALDPCAGEGIALAAVVGRVGGAAHPYAVEIDADRAREAARRIMNVLCASYENVRTTPGAYGLLWLNPPYDADETLPGRRVEYAFLKRATDWLAPGGVLAYLIPDYRISPNVARFLASRYRDILVYRFPEKDYARFKQVVVLASRRPEPVEDETTVARLLAVAEASNRPGAAPPIESGTGEYRIPADSGGEGTSGPRFVFRLAEAPPEEAIDEARHHGAWSLPAIRDALAPPRLGDIRPLLPLRRGHIAMLLAAGCLDNAVLERGTGRRTRRAIVKGRLEKVALDRTSDADRGEGATRTLETFRARIEALELGTGDLEVIDDETALRRWFGVWRDALLEYLATTARPVHTGDLGPFAPTLGAIGKSRRLPGRRETGLFEAQKHVAAAVARHLTAGGRTAIVQATMGTGKTTMAVAVAEILRSRYRDAA